MTETPSTSSSLRSLLEDVAAGRIDPAAAAHQLSATPPPPAPAYGIPDASPYAVPTASGTFAETSGRSPSHAEPAVERVVISVAAGKLVLTGDRSVTTVDVSGPIVATREGTTLRLDNRSVVESSFRFEPGRRGRDDRDDRDRGWRRWRNAFPNGETITVRVNPELPVELSVAAGSAQVSGLRGGLNFRVDAGALRAFDGAGPLEGRVASGAGQVEWLVTDGNSSLRAELGSLKVRLLPGSDVTVSARSELGAVELGSTSVKGDDGRRRLTVGSGRATLDIDVDLGSAKVQTP
jgi:hypothetical protein